MNGNYITAAALALIALSKRQGSMGRGRKRKERQWTPEELELLGTMSDWDLSKIIGIYERAVAEKRDELGIIPFDSNPDYERGSHGPRYDWTPEKVAMLGTMSDRDLALLLDIHYSVVFNERNRRGIPSFGGSKRNYEDFDFSIIPISAFHHSPDSAISRDYGVDNPLWVKRYREENDIMGYQEYFDAAYNLCKILPYRFVAKVMGYEDIPSFKNRLRSRLQKDVGSRFGKFHDHIVEDFPENMSPPDANSFTLDLLFNIGTATSFMLDYWYPASFADIEKVKQYLNIEPYTRTITDPLTDLSPDEIALFFTKSDEWNSEAFGIPLRTIKGMRLYYMEHFGLYPPGVTEDQKSRLVEKIAQQMRKASSEIYQTGYLSAFRRRR